MALVLLGANNPETVRVITAIRRERPLEVLGFLDNDPVKKNSDFFGYPVLGGFEMLPGLVAEHEFVNIITRDCATRYETSKHIVEAGGRLTNLIHPNVDLEMTTIGVGNYIQESVLLQAAVAVGNNSSVSFGSLIGHESVIGNSVFFAPGCHVSGIVHVEDGVFVGTGCTILPRLTIGRWSVIGAGSVVTADVPPYSVVVGNPARVLRTIVPAHDSGDVV
jgi:sugar O-acyltransferase (sialic acid O-acetyltransferase NeuD family)